jgi:F-type H+-transporting ATPase subunit epsilon
MVEKKLALKIFTPVSTLFEGRVEKVIVPAYDGEMGVLPGHASLVSLLGMGELRATENGEVRYFAVFGGYMRVVDNAVSILADRAEAKETIDSGEARTRLGELTEIPAGRRTEADTDEMARCRIRMKVAGRQA